ncbi:MAG: hypothetical protein JO013_08335 [Alphaproteobacteria bacterium]|nr:hypothetical protein [Alphaproteobacteria bacterium]
MRLWIFLPLLLAACGKAHAPKPQRHDKPTYAYPQVNPEARKAAEVLRRYYDRIEAGDYDAAYALRTAGGADKPRFVANFRAYESYHAELGAAGGPATQGDFDYVEVPVMTTGRFVGGKPFGTSGRVMLRRARTGTDRRWYVLAL